MTNRSDAGGILEQKLLSIVAPSLLVVAGCAAFALTNWPSLASLGLALIRDASLVAASALWLSLGLRSMRRDGVTFRNALLPLAGLLLLVGIGFAGFVALRFYESLADPNPDTERLEQNATAVLADPDSTPSQRASASEFKARRTFTSTGEIVPVLDESGAETPFQPTEQDQEKRRAEQQLRIIARDGPVGMRVFLGALGVVTLVALGVGVATPIRRAPAA